ncbi:MAG: hypothetical protein HYT80_01050 [Euryarchaeota archaeon]|nr:hypothetical protein [Euryarchaeota archaeon]
MPYKDADEARLADRRYKAQARAGLSSPRLALLPEDTRRAVAEKVLTLLGEEIEHLRASKWVAWDARARAIGYLCSVTLRAIEAAGGPPTVTFLIPAGEGDVGRPVAPSAPPSLSPTTALA